MFFKEILSKWKKVVPRFYLMTNSNIYEFHKKKKNQQKKDLVENAIKTSVGGGVDIFLILRENKAPPEKYEEAIQIYKNYVQTGELVFPDNKFKGDKAKQIATQYMIKGKKNKK